MLAGDSENVEGSELSGLARCFDVEFRTDTASEFCAVAFGGKHAAEKKQIAGLHCFHVGAERLGWRGEMDAKFFKPLLGAGRPRAFTNYHLPACTPPSTCKISPVVKVASIRNNAASTTSWISPILPNGFNPFKAS